MSDNLGAHAAGYSTFQCDNAVDMAAYDKLPPVVRREISTAPCRFGATDVSLFVDKYGAQRTADLIKRQSERVVADAYRERGL